MGGGGDVFFVIFLSLGVCFWHNWLIFFSDDILEAHWYGRFYVVFDFCIQMQKSTESPDKTQVQKNDYYIIYIFGGWGAEGGKGG